jgi:NAD(P)-dependent dehydrogenase (short-subunit alcohol dehydrogenase family)
MFGVMIVTGAGKGIGAAIAELAGRRGYAVCVNYAHSQDAAEQVVARIAGAGGKAIAVQTDVSQPTEAKRLFEETDRRLGRVDALVNNAGIIGRQVRLDDAVLAQVFAVNTFSYFYCAREAIRRMSTQHGGKGGAILDVSGRR